jgi:membrane-bound serine protease (ClpP class)
MIYVFFMSVVGLVLIYAEFFVPGGILALIGGVALLLSAISAASYLPLWAAIAFWILLAVALTGVIKLAILRVSKSDGRMLSSASQEGYMAHEKVDNRIGQVGEALTDLRPAGFVLIEGERMTAVSYIGYVKKGSPVTVVKVEGSDIIVKEI